MNHSSDPLPVETHSFVRRQAAVAEMGRYVANPTEDEMHGQDAARLIAETLDLPYCGFAMREAEQSSLAFLLLPTSDEQGVGAQHSLQEDPQGTNSMVAYALHTGQMVVSENLEQDTRFSDTLLQEAGIKSGMACPFGRNDSIQGVICVYSDSPQEFPPEDRLFVDSIAQMLFVTIVASHRTPAASDALSQAVLETVDALVMQLGPKGEILLLNRACRELAGFSSEEVNGRTIWNAILAPEEIGQVKRVFQRLVAGESPSNFESHLITSTGDRRRIAWSFTTLRGSEGAVESLIGTGIDITEKCQLANELVQAKQEAAQAQAEIKKILKSQRTSPAEAEQAFTVVKGELSDRRRRPRRSYPYLQRIAPITGDKLPAPEDFYDIKCRDIAAGGFSFLTAVKPSHKEYVIAFGMEPSLTYLIAEPIHVTPTMKNGREAYLVGCRYTGRLDAIR